MNIASRCHINQNQLLINPILGMRKQTPESFKFKNQFNIIQQNEVIEWHNQHMNNENREGIKSVKKVGTN
jgi:hypothetical protein